MADYDFESVPFFHGVEFVRLTTPVAQKRDYKRLGIIVVAGIADAADADVYPLNTPVLISGTKAEITALGATGTLVDFAKVAFADKQRLVIMLRTEVGADDTETLNNLIGGVDVDGKPFGLEAIINCESETGLEPGIIIAPDFSREVAVSNAMLQMASLVDAICFSDCPNAETDNHAAAIAYAANFDDRRSNPVYPDVVRGGEIYPYSIVAALIEADTDYYASSTNTLLDIDGLTRNITFREGASASIANQLNAAGVTTVIRRGSEFRMYGMRNSCTDPLWQMRHHVRLDDGIKISTVMAMQPFKGMNLTKAMLDTAQANIQSYLGILQRLDAIVDARVWLDPEHNTAANWQENKVFFSFDYGRYGSAEQIFILRQLNNNYLDNLVESILGDA